LKKLNISSYGHANFQPPHLEKLAAEAAPFTICYSPPTNAKSPALR
jgi:hypothetical protein